MVEPKSHNSCNPVAQDIVNERRSLPQVPLVDGVLTLLKPKPVTAQHMKEQKDRQTSVP